MAKLNGFIKGLIAKAGGNADEEKIKASLAAIGADSEIGDDLVTLIEHGLLSVESAKNNHPDIKKHYYASAYNGLDSELDRLIEDEKLPEEIINELKSERSSTKRAALLALKLKEVERTKAASNKTADTKPLNDKITELNNLLRTKEESINGIHSDYKKQLRDKVKSYAMRNILDGYNTIHDKLDPETKSIIINAIIDKNLKTKGYQLDVDDNDNLVILTKDGSTAFSEDHRQLTPKIFLDKLMADEKIMVVSDANQNNNQSNNLGGNTNRNNNNNLGGNNRNTNQNQNNNGGGKPNTVLQDLIKQSSDAFNNSNIGF